MRSCAGLNGGEVLENACKRKLAALGEVAHDVSGVGWGKKVDRRLTTAVLVLGCFGIGKDARYVLLTRIAVGAA